MEVSYFTSGLTWKMDYVGITDPDETTMGFRGYVRVFNSSGEEYDNAEIRHGADTREVDIDFQGSIVCGKFIDEERPTFLEMMHEHYEKTLGEKYVRMAPEGGMIHETD